MAIIAKLPKWIEKFVGVKKEMKQIEKVGKSTKAATKKIVKKAVKK